MLQSYQDQSDKAEIDNISSLRTSQQYSNQQGINLKSIQIVKPQLDLNSNKKLTISLVLHQLDDQLRKLVRQISLNYAMSLYNHWDLYWAQQKQLTKTEKKKGKSFECGQAQLIITDNQGLNKVMREMKINPTLRVVLICQNIAQFQLKEQHSFVLVTDDWKQIKHYLAQNKKKIILTSKN